LHASDKKEDGNNVHSSPPPPCLGSGKMQNCVVLVNEDPSLEKKKTLLVSEGYIESTLLPCPSKSLRYGNKNTLFLGMVFSALFNRLFKGSG
jgi:hypothetical protein